MEIVVLDAEFNSLSNSTRFQQGHQYKNRFFSRTQFLYTLLCTQVKLAPYSSFLCLDLLYHWCQLWKWLCQMQNLILYRTVVNSIRIIRIKMETALKYSVFSLDIGEVSTIFEFSLSRFAVRMQNENTVYIYNTKTEQGRNIIGREAYQY